MSKIYDKYVKLKSSKDYQANTVYLFKSGIFFIFIEEDAKTMSQLLGLKLGNLNETIVKCGFPIPSLEKYLHLLSNTNYQVEIVNLDTDTVNDSEDYMHNQDIQKIIDSILSTNIDNLSISESYDFLYDIQKKLNYIVRGTKIEH
ncbi:MAG: hypothetical protein ACLU84_08670 [Clostridia bacterium]